MVEAINAGNEWAMTTRHANATRDAILRVWVLAGFAGYTGSETTFRGQVAAASQLLVHVSRLKDGKRRVMSITEVVGLVDGELVLRDVFRYDLERGEHLDLRGVMP